MKKSKSDIAKHKPTSKDWDKIRALYLQGESLDYVMEQIKDVDVKRSTISEKMSREGINKKRKEMKKKHSANYVKELRKKRLPPMKGIFLYTINLLMLYKLF